MWGIRAIRVGVMLCGLLALVASSGCCSDCKCLRKDSKPLTKKADGSEMTPAERHAATGFWFEDQPSHLKPERVHGGIY